MARQKKNTEGSDDVKFIVIKPFRDINDFSKKWQPGDDVSDFEEKRLERLIQIGVVKKQ